MNRAQNSESGKSKIFNRNELISAHLTMKIEFAPFRLKKGVVW